MAKVLSPIMSADAKGSVGGITFTSTTVGNVAKKKARPVRRARREQDNNRSRLGYLARRWGALTDAQRLEWEAYGDNHPRPDGFGGTFIMSGINAAVSLNMNAMRLGGAGAEQTSPPSDEVPASINSLVAVKGAIANQIDCTVTINGTGEAADFIEFQIAGPFGSKGRVEVFSRYRFDKTITGDLLIASIIGLEIDFWYWIRARYVDEFGQVSAWVYAQQEPYEGI